MKGDRAIPEARIFKSMDPTWPKWGVTPAGFGTTTRWFNTKEDAEHFMATGDDSKAIAGKGRP